MKYETLQPRIQCLESIICAEAQMLSSNLASLAELISKLDEDCYYTPNYDGITHTAKDVQKWADEVKELSDRFDFLSLSSQPYQPV